MPTVASKIVPGGDFRPIDADKVQETDELKVMRSDERDVVARVPGLEERTTGIENSRAETAEYAVSGGDAFLDGVEPRVVFSTADGEVAAFIDTLLRMYMVRAMPLEGVELPGGGRLIPNVSGYAAALTGATGGAMGITDSGTAAVEGVEFVPGEANYDLVVTDANGDVFFGVKDNQFILPGLVLDPAETDWDWAFTDPNGNVFFGFRDGTLEIPGTSSGGTGNAVIADDQNNRDYSATLTSFAMPVQLPTTEYTMIVVYGQSLAEGWETWPSLSKTPATGALMLGDNVDAATYVNSYTLIGSAALNPMVANTHDQTVNLTGGQEAALTPGDGAIGEPPVIALTNGLRRAILRRALTEDDGRKMIALNPGYGGQTVAELSTTRYPRVASGIDQAQALLGGAAHSVSILGYVQGEDDYADGTPRATYAASLTALFDQLVTDIEANTGQLKPPLFMLGQTSAVYTVDQDVNDVLGLNIGMAQIDVMRARADTVMVGPTYPYTDKGGHLDSNGSRWMGAQFAKVAERVLLEGRAWQPLRPIKIVSADTWIDVHYHVPVAPIRFAPSHIVSAPTEYADKGFRVTTAAGANLSIASVEILAPTIVRITMTASPPADAILWYADKTVHNGNGNVCDSDPALATDNYEYVPDRGMYAAANIADLVGKPYPLNNWSVAFSLPLDYSEI